MFDVVYMRVGRGNGREKVGQGVKIAFEAPGDIRLSFACGAHTPVHGFKGMVVV